MGNHGNCTGFKQPSPIQWRRTPGQTPEQIQHIYPHLHHGTPAQDFPGFHSGLPQLPMEPRNDIQQGPMHPQLQPLTMHQWPSMFNSGSLLNYQPVYMKPIQPMSIGPLETPISATSTRSTSTPRKTLTDADRKRICQYAEDHPNSKQTEMGAIFGVERSTVSKVLRDREKYLLQDDGSDGSRSSIKRAKGRSPDIERALAVWAKNQEKKGLPLSDDVIRDKARAFAATTTSPTDHYVLSSSWIGKFKLKNNLMGARPRKSSLAPDAEGISNATSSSHTPSGTSPVSPHGIGSPELHSAQSQESLKNESPDSYIDFGSRHGPFHSQSTTSLNSAFTDTAPSPFVPSLTARPILPATTSANNSQRPRSQTFPLLDQYMSTPRYVTSTILDSPMEEAQDPLINIDEAARVTRPEDRPHTVTPSEMMRPPPLPAHILAGEVKRELTPATAMSSLQTSTSPEEARRALEVVMAFIEQQPNGFLDFQESMHMGKLMEKLKLQSRAGS